jgi:hypothetical protein
MSMLTEQVHAFVDQLAKGLELVGVAIIVVAHQERSERTSSALLSPFASDGGCLR